MGEQDRLEAGTPSSRGAGAITALVDAIQPMDESTAASLHEASHAMRTPLTSIIGFVEMLAEGGAGPLTVDQERLLGIIAGSASDLLRMVDAFDPDVPGPPAGQATAEPTLWPERRRSREFRG